MYPLAISVIFVHVYQRHVQQHVAKRLFRSKDSHMSVSVHILEHTRIIPSEVVDALMYSMIITCMS